VRIAERFFYAVTQRIFLMVKLKL